jgi:hypothetical protein
LKLLGVLLLLALQLGCTATCVRDSDCIGNSICIDDRCILLVRRDAGSMTSSQGGANASAGSGSAGEAGSTQGQGVGGASTDPRLNLDAAADATPEDSPR